MSAHDSINAPSLLLLPSPPRPATPDAVRAAYRGPLAAVISRLSDENKPNTARGVAPVLVVAVASPVLTSPPSPASAGNTRAVCWKRAQSLLAEVYSLVAAICAQGAIASDLEADDAGAVDVRVVLVHHDSAAAEYKPGPRGTYEPNNTTILDLATFASTVYPWRTIFHTSSEQGYELQSAYLKYAEGSQRLRQSQLVAVEDGLSLSNSAASVSSDSQIPREPTKSYKTVCLGGTFDHLHPGHKLFLHAAILLLDLDVDATPSADRTRSELVIGISSDALLAKKKYAEQLQSWDIRACSVINFISTLLNSSTTATTEMKPVQADTKQLHALFRDGNLLVRCVDFHDLYGPTVQIEAIQALVVSGETRSGGRAVNDKRQSQGWSILDLFEIDVLDAGIDTPQGTTKDNATGTNFESKISSTEIRKQKSERLANSQ